MSINGFFKLSDAQITHLAGAPVPPVWSRHYEYAWAIRYAHPGQVVADMGAGWHERPFKHYLAETCDAVYAVDIHPEFVELDKQRRFPDNMRAIVADMTTVDLPPLDRIFCISVLEDIGDLKRRALAHFRELLKPDGLLVLCFDSQYDMDVPLKEWPGVQIDGFIQDVAAAGLRFVGDIDLDKTGALVNRQWNLAVFHCVLERA